MNQWVKTIEKLETDLTEAYEIIINTNYIVHDLSKTCLSCGKSNCHEAGCIVGKAELWMEG